ncbi:alpha/beta hydrolase [Methylomonas sp. AM2-LC]|uniref:alpha/beta fold hydrolase n=1 Tax=Methylomonas sp. AM2-LC TaxID=3153301 RepID=UPI003267506C
MKSFDPLLKNAVKVTGKFDAQQTLLFIHGFGTDQTAWHNIAEAFANEYRLVVFDNTGTGRSIPEAFVQAKYLNLNTYAEDVLDICHALEQRNIILVGHSVGSMIAILAAIKQPDLFSKVILIGASPRYLNDFGYFGGFSDYDLNDIYQAITIDFNNWLDQFSKQAMANLHKPSLAQNFSKSIQTIPQEQILTSLCAIFQSDHRADVEKLTKPALIIQTKDDPFVPIEVAQYLNTAIKGSRLAIIDGSGHLPHISHPAAVITAINSFLG